MVAGAPIEERIAAAGGGVVLADARFGLAPIADWCSSAHWSSAGALRAQPGGRGGVSIVATPAGEAVLRHYRRGGAVASALGDRYLWTGADATRSFAEWRLLAWMRGQNLPVPQPLAARYVRRGLFYTADLLTLRIPDTRTLAEHVAAGRLDGPLAGRVGELVGRFHRVGVWHADLNAHNVLVGSDALHLLDFDRGRRRPIAIGWQRANLARLRRSLLKLGAANAGEAAFEHLVWQPLLEGHVRSVRA